MVHTGGNRGGFTIEYTGCIPVHCITLCVSQCARMWHSWPIASEQKLCGERRRMIEFERFAMYQSVRLSLCLWKSLWKKVREPERPTRAECTFWAHSELKLPGVYILDCRSAQPQQTERDLEPADATALHDRIAGTGQCLGACWVYRPAVCTLFASFFLSNCQKVFLLQLFARIFRLL